jgi:hypothetical protein
VALLLVLGCLLTASGCRRLGTARPRSDTFDAKGVAIHYLALGAGPPVVLIHGLGSSALLNWRLPGIMDALAQRHTVIAFDLPGHGESDKPTDASAYGVQMAEDAALLLDHLHLPKAQVVGYSLGGLVALKLAAIHPDRVTALSLGGIGWMRDAGSSSKAEELLPSGAPGLLPLACIRSIPELALSEPELRALKLPVKLFIGENDPVRKTHLPALQAVRPDWPVVAISDAGHISAVTKPQFRDELVSWVAANDAR